MEKGPQDSLTARATNIEVLRRINSGRELLKEIRRRQTEFLGHVMRREALENLSLTGKIEGKRGRGRPRIKFMDGIVEEVGGGVSPAHLLQMSRDRELWSAVVVNVFRDTAL